MILLVCIPPVLHQFFPDLYLNMLNITIFNSMSWYAGYYFLVVLCGALFLNNFLGKLDYKKHLAFLLTIFALIELSWSGSILESVASGLRILFTGIFLYTLGGFIKKYEPFKKLRVYVFFLIVFLMYVLVWISGYNVTETNIESYIRSGNTGEFTQTILTYTNWSIVPIVIGISMFEVFRRIRIPKSRAVGFLGAATFMVYLVHDNNLFYELWNRCDWVTLLAQSPVRFVLYLLKYAVGTFLVGVAAYALYHLAMVLLHKGRRLAVKD